MISFATVAMIAWIPLIMISFSLTSPRRAVIAAYLTGWLFLPILSWDLPTLPSYDKHTATSLGVICAIVLFDPGALLRFRPTLLDLPVLLLCVSPIFSSLWNGLGLYDGIANAWKQVITWSIPWVVGRCYLSSLAAMRELAVGMFIGAAIYVPLCLYEMAYGAELHRRIYGFSQHLVEQTVRADGAIRPMVFMQHGLILSMWLGVSALAGLAASKAGGLVRLPVFARHVLLFAVFATVLFCRSLGATTLMLVGLATWISVRMGRTAIPVLALVAVVPTYMTLRATGALTRSDLRDGISVGLNLLGSSQAEIAARLQSADTRFIGEDEMCSEAWQSPLFGANSWRIGLRVDPQTGEIRETILDGLWAILFATRGLVGLASWMLMFLLPVVLFVRRYPAGTWSHPLVATVGMFAIILVVHGIDCLLNADSTPIYACIAGGIAGVPALRGQALSAGRAPKQSSAPEPGSVLGVKARSC